MDRRKLILMGSRPRYTTAALATRSALKSQIVANGGTYSTMSTSPTLTLGSSGGAATLSGSIVARTDSRLTYLGGDYTQMPGAYPQTLFGASFVAHLGDGSLKLVPNAAKYRFKTSCVKFESYLYGGGATSYLRLIVDGEVSANALTTIPSDGSLRYLLVDFTPLSGSPVMREIEIQAAFGSRWGGLKLDTSGGVLEATAVAPRLKLCVLGDSFVEGTGADYAWNCFVQRTARVLGFDDARQSGFGGTGWTKDNSGSNYPSLDTRFALDAIAPATDVYIMAMGINDSVGIQGTVVRNLRQLAAARPSAMIYCLGPWNPSAPTAQTGTPLAVKNEIQAACNGLTNVKFLDPAGRSYTKFDATHPDTAGHVTLGDWLADQIKADLGL